MDKTPVKKTVLAYSIENFPRGKPRTFFEDGVKLVIFGRLMRAHQRIERHFEELNVKLTSTQGMMT